MCTMLSRMMLIPSVVVAVHEHHLAFSVDSGGSAEEVDSTHVVEEDLNSHDQAAKLWPLARASCQCRKTMGGLSKLDESNPMKNVVVQDRKECQDRAVQFNLTIYNYGYNKKYGQGRCAVFDLGQCNTCHRQSYSELKWHKYRAPADTVAEDDHNDSEPVDGDDVEEPAVDDEEESELDDEEEAATPPPLEMLPGDTISCSMERAIKRVWARSAGTASIRGVFHDAMDHNNLLLKNMNTNLWEPFELTAGAEYGGLDGCLYSPLTHGTGGSPNPGHNRNVPGILPRAAEICRATCNLRPGLRICSGAKQNGVPQNCAVDVTIMGANAVISSLKGPDVPMLWGHRKGDCGYNGIVTPFQKFCRKDCQKEYSEFPALRFAPSFTDIQDPSHFTQVFDQLGFNSQDHVALMGAHSVGIIEPCAEGLNGIEIGPFCKGQEALLPPVTETDMIPPWGTCELTHKNSCWRRNRGQEPPVAPVHRTLNGNGNQVLNGFGDGGVWDNTPNKFDNDYFRIMNASEFEDMNMCCGIAGTQATRFNLGGHCGRTGIMKRYKGGPRNDRPHMYTWKKGKKECYYHSGVWENKEPSKKLVPPFDERWKDPRYANLKCYDSKGRWINALNSTEPSQRNPMQGVHPSDIKFETTRENVDNRVCNWEAKKPSFCRDDRKGRTHMKSLNMQVKVQALLLKNAAQHGNILRVVRLPGDWALLAGDDTAKVITEFAADQSKFFDAFSTAWEKVLRKTGAPLESCSGEVDEAQVDDLVAQYQSRLSLLEEMQDSDIDSSA